jgi:hypothetical protein
MCNQELRFESAVSRFTAVIVLVVLTLLPISAQAQSQDPDVRRFLAWGLASQLSLAALGYGRGADQAIVNQMIDQVRPAAAELGLEIPPLPPKEGNSVRDTAAVLHYLLSAVGDGMGGKLSRNFPSDYSLLFEVALKSNILILMYMPNDDTSLAIAGVIRDRAPRAGIPYNMWRPVVNAVESGAPQSEVTAAVRAMHKDVSAYLYPN